MAEQLGLNFHPQSTPIGILNVHKGKFLAVGSVFCENRKNVTLGNCNNAWTLIKEDDGTFRIRYANGGYYDLYAASEGFKFDNDRRRVFCWGELCSVTQGFWRFESTGNGEFLIKNTQHNEYLYAADFPNTSAIFTWNGECLDYAQNPKFRWRFTNCPPDVADTNRDILGTLEAIKTFAGFLPPPVGLVANLACDTVGNLLK